MNCCICFFRCCVASSCCSVGCPFSSTYYAWLQKRNVWKYEKKEKWWNCEHCYCCCWFCFVGFFAPCILDEVVSFRHVWHRHQSLGIYQEQKHFRETDLSEICGYLVLTIAIFPTDFFPNLSMELCSWNSPDCNLRFISFEVSAWVCTMSHRSLIIQSICYDNALKLTN